MNPHSDVIASLGFKPREARLLRRVARRVRSSPKATVAAIVRSALGASFCTGSLPYRVQDACNEIDEETDSHGS